MNDEPHSPRKLGVLCIASEAAPRVKAGGLGDVAGSLPAAIHGLSKSDPGVAIDIRLVIPFYTSIRKQVKAARLVARFDIATQNGPVEAQVYETHLSGVTTYLVAGEPVSRTDEIYGSDFKSDAEKFVFFSLACLQVPAALNWNCAILHANDWHTAIALHQLPREQKKNLSIKSARSILTIHNLPFMGTGAEDALTLYGIQPSQDKILPNWAKTLPLPMGLAAAEKIIAVSPTYAQEILTPEYGCDLQDFLKTRQSKLSGILNGIDTEAWDPGIDIHIPARFTVANLANRKLNKSALEHEFQYPAEPETPLMVLISRMDRQKGVDIIVEGLRMIKNRPWRAILLGTGDSKLEQACRDLEAELPGKVRTAIQFDTKLSRRMYAGADILLMPSRYEPCGLSQMFAMRYGCLPYARATGGLVDTVFDPESSSKPTGFLFREANALSFANGLVRVLDAYQDSEAWMKMQVNGLSQDFSWSRSARNYINIYTHLSGISRNGGKHEPSP